MKKSSPKHRGRPALDPSERRRNTIQVMATASQHQRIRDTAAAYGLTVSSWLLAIGLDAAAQGYSAARLRRLKQRLLEEDLPQPTETEP